MKNLALTLVLTIATAFSYAQDSEKNTITVTIENVKNDNGKVLFGLHTKDTFMKGQGILNAESKIENGKVVITFENVEPGEYAIMVLHDENENNRMDFESNGMPKEDYGMSNNPMSFGPPNYADAKFDYSGKALELNIKF